MNAEILAEPPVSGSIPERWYDATGDCVWVRFDDGDNGEGGAWAGVFGSSRLTGRASVTLFGGGPWALVIAGGRGYVVDTRTGELRHRTECDYLVDAIAVPGRDLVVACDFTDLYAYSASALVWRSDRVALDGIEFDPAGPRELRGRVWGGSEWHPFRLDLDRWEFREGPWQAWAWLQRF